VLFQRQIQQITSVGRAQVEVHQERIKRALFELRQGFLLARHGCHLPGGTERLGYLARHLWVADRQQYAF
jgi:hypothetical protein